MYGYAAQNPATVDGINAAYEIGFEKSPPVNNISHPFSASSMDNIDINDIFHAIESDFRSGSLSLPLFNKTVSNNNFQNVHNNTYEISIKNKKESIILEYNKFYNKFLKIVSYFKECSDGVIDQIDNSKLLKFFLKGKSI